MRWVQEQAGLFLCSVPFSFRFEMPSGQGWFPLLRYWRGSKSVFTVFLNAMVPCTCWAGMAECCVSECFLEAADPAGKGKWHTVSGPDLVPSSKQAWASRGLWGKEGQYWIKLVIDDTACKWLHWHICTWIQFFVSWKQT